MNNTFTVRAVIYRVINELNLPTTNEYERLKAFAFDGMNYLKINASKSVKVKYFSIPETLQVRLPHDYVQYTKIGVITNGRVVMLGLDDRLALPEAPSIDGPGIHEVLADSLYSDSIGFYFAPHIYNGQAISALFGMGGGRFQDYYKIDKVNKQIIFSNDLPGKQIVMEYIGVDGLCDDSYVPPHYVEALKAWILWRNVENDSRVPMNEKMRREQQFYIFLKQGYNVENPVNIDELMAVIYEASFQGPKTGI